MFIDSRELDENSRLLADVCIIGAGAAGISIAREFIATGRSVILLESGGLEFDQDIQALYSGDNTGLPSFDIDVNRLRYFGGTTNHWAGHSRPLDPIDFEEKKWMPHSGWPIAREDLEDYYRRAHPVLELGRFDYENLGTLTQAAGLEALKLDNHRLKTAVYGQSPPTRFGTAYRDELAQATNIKVCLFANVLELITDESASHVDYLKVASFNGPQFQVRAAQVILATGGMENARLLLLSKKFSPEGLGNNNDLVGRFFMDHVLLRPGLDVSLTHPGINLRLYHGLHDVDGGRRFAIVAASEKLLREEQISNFRIHLYPTGPHYKTPVGGVFSELDGFTGENPLEKSRNNSIAMHMVLEPVPNPDSRITLSERKLDTFGQPKLEVKWLVEEADLKHAYRAMELIAMEFGRMGLGRGYSQLFKDRALWPGHMEAGKHHCGTTRMSGNLKTGVVDANCKVFGIDNLYIAGSSVFPTIGYANPTITIVALALRLSDHIKLRLSE